MRRLIVLVSTVVLVAAGCAGPPPMVCDGTICEGPAYWPDTATQIENEVVAVFSAIGVVPIVPRSANGPARRTIGQ